MKTFLRESRRNLPFVFLTVGALLLSYLVFGHFDAIEQLAIVPPEMMEAPSSALSGMPLIPGNEVVEGLRVTVQALTHAHFDILLLGILGGVLLGLAFGMLIADTRVPLRSPGNTQD